MAAMWPANRSDDGRRRLGAALLLSVAAHGLMLVGMRGARFETRVPAPLVVTMIARGGDGGASDAPPAAAAAAPVPAVAAPAVAAPAVAKRVAPPRRLAARPAVAAASIPVAPVGEVARADAGGEPAAPTGGTDGTLAAAGSGGGAGSSGRGNGSGAGSGGGSDGLRALCRSCPAPEYPSRARRQRWQGTVDVELAIDGDGAVETARVGRSSGYPALDDVAVAVARTSRFAVPAGGAGLRGQLRYRFVLDATAAVP